MSPRARAPAAPTAAGIDDLPAELLLTVFQHVPVMERCAAAAAAAAWPRPSAAARHQTNHLVCWALLQRFGWDRDSARCCPSQVTAANPSHPP